MNQKTFPIESYFLYFPDKLLDAGQQILDAGKVSEKVENIDGLHLFQIIDDLDLEVEILLRRKTVHSCTCECQTFLESQTCQHIVAAIKLLLKNREDQRALRKKKKSAVPKNVGLKNLLSKISDQELRTFVIHFGRYSPEFSLALRTQFADRVVTADNHLKYYQLIRKYVIQIGMRSVNITKAKKFARYTDDLLLKSDDLLSTGDFREAFHVLYGLLHFFNSRSLADYESILREALLSIYRRFDVFFSKEFAPALRQELIDLLWGLTKEDYRLHDSIQNLFYLIHTYGNSDNRENCLESLKARTKDGAVDIPSLVCYLHLLLSDNTNKNLVTELFHQRSYRVDELTAMLQTTLDLNHHDLVLSRATELFENPYSPEVKRVAFRFLIKALANSDQQISWYTRYFLEDGRKEIYLEAKEKFPDRWKEGINEVIHELSNRKAYDLLAFLYKTEGQIQNLLKLLQQSDSLDFILQHSSPLYPAYRVELKQMIERELLRYLETHVGFHSISFVENVFQTLYRKGMTDIAESCRTVIIKRFGDRMFLGKSLKSL